MVKSFLGSLALAFVVLGSTTLFAGVPLKLEESKSKIDFVGKKTDGQHSGGFKKFTIDAVADHDDPSKSSISIDIDADSLWADDKNLEGHLKNPDFFNVKKFPSIKFESTKITPDGDAKATIKGKLTMLGKTAEVDIPVKVQAGDSGVTLDATFKIDRTQWGMDYGVGKIDKEVEINIVFVFKTK